jgi:murein L,D-transpeptidase YcbB/YkuD
MHVVKLRKSLAALIIVCISSVGFAAPRDGSAQIRSFLEGLDAGDVPVVAGRRLNEPDLLSSVYRAREHAPIWLRGAPLEKEVSNLLTAIGQSVSHGFSAERYHRPAIEKLTQAGDESSRLSLELLLTDAFLSQALHRGRGAVFPPNLDAEWQMPQAEVDAGELLRDTAQHRRAVLPVLDMLWPPDEEYARLLRRRAEIVASDEEITVQIAAGPLLKPGQSGDRVVMLKERLMGPGEYSPVYDDDLRREVTAFQRAAGLEPDGIVGENTIEILNATRVSWIDRIDANLERWRWLPRETPDTYIRVNIAAFVLRAMENGRPALSMNVIVGQPYRRTPVFTETIKYLVLNPYWNVPYSIATKDKLPLLKSDASAQAKKGFEAKSHGSDVFVSVDAIDWAGVTPRNFNYLLRQRPGTNNALGRIKFMLPNPNSVYLHDTPSRELFARQERTFSSGCIRLEQPVQLAEWLLSLDGHPDVNKMETLLGTGETRTIYLKKPLPTYVVYFTAFSLDEGNVIFRRDVYGRDRVLIQALRDQQS